MKTEPKDDIEDHHSIADIEAVHDDGMSIGDYSADEGTPGHISSLDSLIAVSNFLLQLTRVANRILQLQKTNCSDSKESC